MDLGKVAIFVGGPDWPTSVTCGILNLNIPQMLLGTLPVYIASIAPQTLVGALITKEADGNATLWSTITTACTGVAAVSQAAACLVATRAIIQTIELEGEELAKERPEHAKVAELTAKQADFVKKYAEVESWTGPDAMSARRKATISLAAWLQLLAGFLLASDFVLMEPVCFRKFAVNDSIGRDLNGNALNVIIVPLGVLALSIWAFASGLHYFHGKDLTRLARKKLAADGE
mmetsp:Transcript_102760/g.294916  ORF Transcript_102760/g.294916 Transcript_102760/m.294916 type:complete len:232 (+) Transcript_102760:1-696(+)